MQELLFSILTVARALNRLQAMKQGRESFSTFLPKFEKELGESQLTMVPDMVKIGYLRGALNLEMQRAMIGPVTYVHYGKFVQALLAIGSQLDCLQYQKGRATPMTITNRVWPDEDGLGAYRSSKKALKTPDAR